MPLATYPEAVADGSIFAAVGFAASLECTVHVTTFPVDIPQVSSSLGSLLVDIPGLVHAAEEKSKAECQRLQGLVQGAAGSRLKVHCANREVALGGALDAAATEARYFELAVLPWSDESLGAQDMAQAIVFGSGRPTILVPPSARPASLDHIAVAWDASRVAARALGDALPLLAEGGRVSVLTVQDEKSLSRSDLADALASSLEKRGLNATPLDVTLGQKTIAAALQDSALSEGRSFWRWEASAILASVTSYSAVRLRECLPSSGFRPCFRIEWKFLLYLGLALRHLDAPGSRAG